MFRSLTKYIGTPLMTTSLFTPVAYCKEAGKPGDVYKEPEGQGCTKQLQEATELERLIAKCRQEVTPMKEGVTNFATDVATYAKNASCTIGRNVDYLRSAPQEVQVGAICAGTLLGSLLGFRRGIFRKIWFGGLGGLTTAAVIFPEDAHVIGKETFQAMKTYSIIAYRFILGPAAPTGTPKKDCSPPPPEPKEEYCDCPPESKS